MFGQLLIFSDDYFENNIYSGVIREKDCDKMDKSTRKFGFVTIGIELIQNAELNG